MARGNHKGQRVAEGRGPSPARAGARAPSPASGARGKRGAEGRSLFGTVLDDVIHFVATALVAVAVLAITVVAVAAFADLVETVRLWTPGP